MEKTFYVYILASKRNGTLYIGVTSDLVKRIWQHRSEEVPGFTEKYDVKILVYYEQHLNVESAIHREKRLKEWKRQWKLALIEQYNPNWCDLYFDIVCMSCLHFWIPRSSRGMTTKKEKHMPSKPWIYNLADYRQMFDLTDDDLKNKKILNYPAGISSFNAELYQQGISIVSADVHYQLPPLDMSTYVDEVVQQWSEVLPQDADLNNRNHYAQLFVTDYSVGKTEQRYQFANFPQLPFSNFQFDLALCPDFFFQNNIDESNRALLELSRVAEELRIFPLLDHKGKIPETIGAAITTLQDKNYGIEIRQVPFRSFQPCHPERKRGISDEMTNHAMLRVWAKECPIA